MSEQLYKNLQKEYDLPEYEDWLDDMQDDSKRQMAFDNLSNPNFTYEDWTAELVPQFDPEADGYDASSALRSGSRSYKPDSWGSLEPYTGKVLLGRNHESWDKMVEGEKFKGNVVVKGEDGRFYSKKNINQLSQSVNYTPPSSLKVDYTAQKIIPIKSQKDPRTMNFSKTIEVDGRVLGLVKEDQNIADKLIDFESGFQDDTAPVEENVDEIIQSLIYDVSDESWATDETLSYEEKKAIHDEHMQKLQEARNLQNQGYKVYDLNDESYVPVDWNVFERRIQNNAILQGLSMGDLPQSGFFSELQKNWVVNDTRALQDQANYDIITGDNVEAREALVEAHKNQLGPVKFTDDKSNIIEDIFHSSVAVLPDIKGYGLKALDWGLKAGATSATVGGLATGGAGAIPSGITGFSYGARAGSTYYWYRQGTQELYLDLRRDGIDHDIAIANAKAFAVPYASTELVSLGIVGKNLKAITKSQIKDQIKKRITKGAVVRLSKEYGKDYFKEIGQELTQELILDTGEDVAKYMSNRMRGTDIEYDPFEERLDRYEDVVKETAKAIIPIVGLGAGVRVATEYKMDPAERSYRRKQKRDKFLETTEIGKQIQVARDSGKYDEFTLDFLADMAIRNPDIIEESGAIDLTEKAVNLTQDYFRAELEKNDEVYTDEEWNEVGRDKYVDFLAGEGMTEQDAENIIATGSTENFQDLIEGSTKVLMKLNQGADVSTVVEEMYGWYHRALNDQESFLFQEYYNSIHSNPELKERLYLRLMENGFVDENYDYENNSLSSQEFFEKDGMNYFANQNLYEDSALRKVYRKVMEYFQNLLGISDISPDVVKMYEEAGQFKVKKVTQAQDIEISKEKGIGTPKSYQLSYMGSHRPSREGPPAHNLLEGNKIPDDVYDTPRYYIGSINTGEEKKVYQETIEVINYLKSIKGNPDAEVTVYRAGPKKELNAGDWITLSKTYAKDHSMYFKTPVHKFKVKAKDVLWDMNTLEEWGYYPKGQEVKQNDILDRSFQLRKPSTPTSSGTSMQKSVLQVAKKLKNNSIINPPTIKTPKEEIKKMKNRGNLKGFRESLKYLDEGKDVDGVRQWYDGVDYALEQMAIEVPEVLQSEENKTFALLMLAITSQGTKVQPNYDMAVDIVREYFRTGKMPIRENEIIDSVTKKPKTIYGLVGRGWDGRDRMAGGKLYKAVTGNAQMIERLINDLGLEGAMQYLLETRTGRAHLKSGYKLNEKGNPSLAGFMTANETHYGAEQLGPKIGAFFLNMNGISDIPTLDLWWSRTWNRWMGTPTIIDKKSGKEKVVETPRNKSERNTMIEVLDNISEQLTKETGMEWSNTQVQALLWYYEKDLYQNEGAQVDPAISFREASDVRQEKFNEFTTSNDLGDLRGYEEQRDAEERVLQNRTKSIDQVSKLRQKSFQLRKPRVESVPLWESKIKKSIDGFDVDSDGNLRTTKGQPLKWKDLQSILGVSKTEFKWSFVDDMLESKNPNDKVNKNELVNTLDLERIALEENVRGGKLEGVEEYKPQRINWGKDYAREWTPELKETIGKLTSDTLIDEIDLFYSPEGKDTKELNRLEALNQPFPEEAPNWQFVIASVIHTNDPNAPIIIESYIQNTKTGDIKRASEPYRVWSDEAITSSQGTEIEAEIKAKTIYQEQQARELGLIINAKTKHDSLVRKIKEGGTEPAYHEDYTEHIITLPSLTPRGEVEYIVKPYEDQYGLFAVLGGKEMMISFGTKKEMEQLLRAPDTTDYKTKEDMLGQDYYESPPHHFEDKNIAVFVRHTTRYTPDGKKVLYIDELQSDWATDLKTPSEKRDYEKLNKLFYERRKQWTNLFEETKLYAEWGLKNLKEFAENLLLPVGNDFIRRKVDNFLAGVEVAEESGIENVNHDFVKDDMTDLLALIKTNEDISIDPQLLADFEYKTKQLESQKNITNKADSDHKNYQAETAIKTPPMPYEGYDYIGLALKRMIRKAVDQDYDYVAVTDGKTSADLYSARQVFETVAVNKYIDNGLEYYNAQVLDKSARKIGIKGIGDRNKLDFSRLTAGEVIRAFGKDLGEKIIKGTEEVLPAEYFENKRSEYFNAVTDKDTEINYYNSFYSGTLPQNAYETGTWFRQDYALYLDDKYDQTSKTYVISGKDLEVGGYMHKALYDNAIPNKMNKLGKKFTGTKVEDIEIASYPWDVKEDSEFTSTFSSKAMKITKTLREEGGKPMPSFQLKKGKLPNKLLTGKGKVVKTKDPSFYTEALIPISTRLKRIHPKLRVILRKFEFDLGVKVNADRKTIVPFLNKFQKMNEEDKKILTLALYNGYEESIQEMLDKYDMNSEYVSVQKLLEKFYNDALSVGYDINQIENYFPRLVTDYEGMMNYLGGVDPDSKTIIEEAQKKKEKSLGRKLTDEEKISIANSVIAGHGFKSKSTPRNIKGREIENVSEDLLQFYSSPVESLIGYVDSMNEGIASKKFFGKGEDLGDSIGKFVAGMVEEGLINKTQEREVVTILNARFNKTPMKDFLRTVRDATYIMTMGQFTSAVTQIGDVAWSIVNAPLQTPKALGKAFASALPKINLKRITREDVGVEHVAEEMQDPKGLGKWVNRVFKAIGLDKVDQAGKETLMNATIENFQKKAKADKLTKRQMETLTEIFEDEAPQVIQDLKDGKITENVKFLAFWTLMEFQPASKSEVPQKYLDSPNGRMLYQLKTFTIKQLDVYRNQFWDDLKAGNKARAWGRLATIATAFVVCNGTADAIKDWIRGKPIHLEDIFYENLFRLLGMSRYQIWVAQTYGVEQAVSKFFMPPSGSIASEIFEDFTNIKDWFDGYILEKSSLPLRIPVVGNYIYYTHGKGQKSTINQEYRRLWDKFKEDGSLTRSDQKIFLEWLEKKALHSPPPNTKNVPEWKRKKAKEIKGRYKK